MLCFIAWKMMLEVIVRENESLKENILRAIYGDMELYAKEEIIIEGLYGGWILQGHQLSLLGSIVFKTFLCWFGEWS